MNRIFSALVLCLIVAGTARAGGDEVVVVTDAWVREAPPGAHMHAGYMTLLNPADHDLEWVAVESDAFPDVSIHEMRMVEGLMRMREVEELSIPAGGKVSLAPGGMHLMMTAPEKVLVAGDEVRFMLQFGSGAIQEVVVSVRRD